MGYESRILDSRAVVARDSELNDKLKVYSKIKDELKRENHSPRKGYEGSVEV